MSDSDSALKSLKNEFISFLDSSIHTLNSTGTSPLFAVFLNTSSKNAKGILSKLESDEQTIFQELLDQYQKKNQLENEYAPPLQSRLTPLAFSRV